MVYAFNPLDDARWGEFVDAHPSSSIFHTAGWLEALKATYAYEPLAYTTCGPGAPLRNAIPFCRINSWLTGRRLVSLPFADHCQPLVDQRDDCDDLLAAANGLVSADGGVSYFELRPREPGEWQQHSLQHSASYFFHVLDLRPSIDDLFGSMHKDSMRRRVRRAARESITVEGGNSEGILRSFYGLMVQTRRRQGLPPQPIGWFRNVLGYLRDRATIRIAIRGSQAVGAMLTLRHRNTVVYKYGCSDARHHHLGVMPYLFWTAIVEAKAAGMQTFDLGRSDIDNQGLIRFKQRLGASSTPLTYWRAVRAGRPPRKRSRACGAARRRLVARLPRRVLIAAGRLLYRHMG